MKVTFYGNRQGNWVDKAIRWWTAPLLEKFSGKWQDGYSHCEILFYDNVMFSADAYSNTTRFARKGKYSTGWVDVDVETTDAEERIVRKFCQRHDGRPYDYKGILGFVLGTPDSEGQWFCSEICTAALQEIGLLVHNNPSKVSPNDLYRLLQELENESK